MPAGEHLTLCSHVIGIMLPVFIKLWLKNPPAAWIDIPVTFLSDGLFILGVARTDPPHPLHQRRKKSPYKLRKEKTKPNLETPSALINEMQCLSNQGLHQFGINFQFICKLSPSLSFQISWRETFTQASSFCAWVFFFPWLIFKFFCNSDHRQSSSEVDGLGFIRLD